MKELNIHHDTEVRLCKMLLWEYMAKRNLVLKLAHDQENRARTEGVIHQVGKLQ